MPAVESIRHVPWTCEWGHFGGPVAPAIPPDGFVFWLCIHPEIGTTAALRRDRCETCPKWQPAGILSGARSA